MQHQLASNYTTFFEKLTQTLDRLAQKLPIYDEIAKHESLWKSPRLRASLVKVYISIFEFLQSVVRVFTQSDGSKFYPILS